MFGTAAFARPAGVLLLGPTVVHMASPQPTVASHQPNLASHQPNLASHQPNLASIRLNRLDTGARG
ncbi:hypothetical protein I0C86_17885 [Plantactinospora sp. S1510]|uniref:Uncharacterized protein n=1 Tax=Plantactinospora alkalitolerans TaxID=2789879 RepID=A0ABS0GXK4_9ACTN|nr:hypothetical protein [Plantactinospora alkalitolerans]MBF9130816.1 hypothetical protein [Plantactinospora alkalitolerans]